MSSDLSKRPELLIVSDTKVCVDNKVNFIAFEPVVREIENFSHIFSSITWLAYKYPFSDKSNNLRTANVPKLNYYLLTAVGGPGFKQRIKIIYTYIRLLIILPRLIRRADVVHTRGPSHPAIVAAFYSIFFFRSKIFWHKYAGNWAAEKNPLSYYLNKSLLLKAKRAKVTINGRWPGQPQHLLSFENPCLTEQEREVGREIIESKNYNNSLDFVFIGNLTESKGVGHILKAFKSLTNEPRIGMLHIVGDGVERNKYENYAYQEKIRCRFYGFLPKNEVNVILAGSHVLLLPSDSEGFPKVVAEGANYGCIPVVSAISSIPQYIKDNINGFLMPSVDPEVLIYCIRKILSMPESELGRMAKNAYEMGDSFTYENYNRRILKDIMEI